MELKSLEQAKIAIICDWLTVAGGAEKVIHGLHQLFPASPIYTTLYNPNRVKGFEHAKIKTSFLQKIPGANRHHQFCLPLMPSAIESFDLSDFDIVISSSHSCAKGVILPPHTLHISYCHSPMRYAWDNFQNYIQEYRINGFLKTLATPLIHKIRIWDRYSADRVDHFISNSKLVQQRIGKFYRRESVVIPPFIEPENFHSRPKKDFYLAVGRLTAYKKFDLIIEAFNKNGLPLKIAGTGNMLSHLQKIAGPNIELLGFVSDQELKQLYSTAKAFIFPQIEDFGITPLEAMASGCPIIAMGAGGALDTITDGQSGYLFKEQTAEAINSAITKLEKSPLSEKTILAQAQKYSKTRFNQNFIDFLEKAWHQHQVTNLI